MESLRCMAMLSQNRSTVKFELKFTHIITCCALVLIVKCANQMRTL